MEALIRAIAGHEKCRLVYKRAKDGVTSIHEIGPVDIRRGDRTTTRDRLYLWAWCFAEGELEMHRIDRIVRVIQMGSPFDPAWVMANWPEAHWPKPDRWMVPRNWS